VHGQRALGHPGDVQQALVEHVPRTVKTLLAGLEHQQHPPGQIRALLGQQPRGGGQHRDVGVVPAGVHRAR
jgi:hypothetical protein